MCDVMVDLETLSTDHDAAIISIGAVVFDKTGVGKTFYTAVTPIDRYFHISFETIKWWMEQSAPARAVFFEKGPDTAVAMASFTAWLNQVDCTRIWGNGATFDITLLESTYRRIGHILPWKYRAPRDVRTILEASGIRVEKVVGVEHNALDDAINQALAVIKAQSILAERVKNTNESMLVPPAPEGTISVDSAAKLIPTSAS